ncbi:proton channel OTOP3-like [Cynoglossus semilaevis]|uniref:proton channel OTOP3-like n=1 Tax=Cynoglossus semilaevis TaxID=244447 RepID=UPI0007DCA540|nr:proton channel OTOP3-like [Cynoglossus semilaevis]
MFGQISGKAWKQNTDQTKQVTKTKMNPDPRATELVDISVVAPQDPTSHQPTDHVNDQELGTEVVVWVPFGRRLISSLLGMNLVLLGAALVSAQIFNAEGLKHQEPQVFMLLLMVVGLIWMLWFLLWTRKQNKTSLHWDHHAGGTTVIVVLVLFTAFSVVLYVCRLGYLISVRACQPAAKVLRTFTEAPFLLLQTYSLWSHSKDCIHRHKVLTRSGLMVVLSADLLLWLDAVTEDTIHQEIELEKEGGLRFGPSSATGEGSETSGNSTLCRCSSSATCLSFRKAFELLYPFNMEYYLMAGCMIYVMWKNVGRRTGPNQHVVQKLTFRIFHRCGLTFGLVFGLLVLLAGLTVFVFYHVRVSQQTFRAQAFLVFYSYHLAVLPVMILCLLFGMVVHRLERRQHDCGHNPTRSLDVVLLMGAALGQVALSYFSVVAALAVGTSGLLGNLDLSYSILSLLELILQNIFIIQGLHRHQNQKKKNITSILKKTKKTSPTHNNTLLEENTSAAPPTGEKRNEPKTWHTRMIQEICAFLIFSNIMLWIIPAFGAHPQLENGVGKQFFGFGTWFVLVNLGQPLTVFYRMHSVAALMELLVSA